jgi:hypothetical protein
MDKPAFRHALDCGWHNGLDCDCGLEGPERPRVIDFDRLKVGDHYTGHDGRDHVKLAPHASGCVAA